MAVMLPGLARVHYPQNAAMHAPSIRIAQESPSSGPELRDNT
jgi:hypothetical protein